MKKHLFTSVMLACALLLLEGCLNLKPAPDQSKFFVLAPRMWVDGPAPYPCDLNVAVVRIEFSDYLDNSQVATRPSREEVAYNAWMRWAEPLSSGLTRTLITNLCFAMGNQLVQPYPNRIPGYKADLMVYAYVVRFDGVLGGECKLIVRWRITSGNGLSVLYSDDMALTALSGANYSDYVKTLSQLWSDFANNVAQEIITLEKAGKVAPASAPKN